LILFVVFTFADVLFDLFEEPLVTFEEFDNFFGEDFVTFVALFDEVELELAVVVFEALVLFEAVVVFEALFIVTFDGLGRSDV
jgi:hypothetical protein